MFHKRKERKDCRGNFWRRSLSFLVVLLLVAGCVQVVGNQAEAASEPLSEFQPETQAGMEVLVSETELVTETESEITTEAHSEPVSESESVANSENLPETETETIRATEADFQLETEWETETASDLNHRRVHSPMLAS